MSDTTEGTIGAGTGTQVAVLEPLTPVDETFNIADTTSLLPDLSDDEPDIIPPLTASTPAIPDATIVVKNEQDAAKEPGPITLSETEKPKKPTIHDFEYEALVGAINNNGDSSELLSLFSLSQGERYVEGWKQRIEQDYRRGDLTIEEARAKMAKIADAQKIAEEMNPGDEFQQRLETIWNDRDNNPELAAAAYDLDVGITEYYLNETNQTVEALAKQVKDHPDDKKSGEALRGALAQRRDLQLKMSQYLDIPADPDKGTPEKKSEKKAAREKLKPRGKENDPNARIGNQIDVLVNMLGIEVPPNESSMPRLLDLFGRASINKEANDDLQERMKRKKLVTLPNGEEAYIQALMGSDQAKSFVESILYKEKNKVNKGNMALLLLSLLQTAAGAVEKAEQQGSRH